MDNTEIAIRVESLSKIYTIYDNPMIRLKDALGLSKVNHGKEFYALDSISFSVGKGKTLGIIGENGAGKSTLLKIITGVLSPSSGTVEIKGRVSALLELGTGFNPEYTGIENIYLNGNIMGFTKEEIDRKIDSILRFADIGDFVHQKVKTYSSGMFARLAFAVAIHVEPEILIVDEALAVGDLFFQQKCNMYMKEKMGHCTKLLVTHDMSSIANMADEAIVISKGKLVFHGEPLKAIAYYTKQTHTQLFQQKNPDSMQGRLDAKNAEKLPEEHQTDASTTWKEIAPDSLGGALEARIDGFRLKVNGEEYNGYVQENDLIEISMRISAKRDIENVMIGYQIKDKYGNIIFGENTHSSGFSEKKLFQQNSYAATIAFYWPAIQENDYFLTLGVGEGTHEIQHVIQCWAHNIFQLNNISLSPNHGLFNNKIEKFVMQEVGQ